MSWNEFKIFSDISKPYLPDYGEGDTMATQIVTAVTKLIYKWFNDGDVYDNRYVLEGFANDLSSFANWLYKYIPQVGHILEGITDCYNDDEYESLLYKLADYTIGDENYLAEMNKKPSQGSVYDCDGPFEFEWRDDEEEEDEYDDYDEYDEDDEYDY